MFTGDQNRAERRVNIGIAKNIQIMPMFPCFLHVKVGNCVLAHVAVYLSLCFDSFLPNSGQKVTFPAKKPEGRNADADRMPLKLW